MRALLLALVVLACSVPSRAQTDGSEWAASSPLRTYASASDPFTIALPPSFVYGAEAEVAPGVRVHHFSELTESGRTVVLTTRTDLDAAGRAAFASGADQNEPGPKTTFVPVAVSALGLPAKLAATAGSAFTALDDEALGGTRTAGVLVRGCDATRCYLLSAQGPDDGSGSGMRFADLLSGLRFTD